MIRLHRNKWQIIRLHPVDLITSPAIRSRKKGQECSWGHNWKQMSHWKSSCPFSGLQLRIWNSWDPNYWGCIAGRREWGMKLGKLHPKDSSWKPSHKALYAREAKKSLFPCLHLPVKKKRKGSWLVKPSLPELWIWNLCPWLKWGTQLHQWLIITDKPK